jgi:hypothetical protein
MVAENVLFPTEEAMTRSYWMDDEYYETHRLGIDTHALVYAAVQALSKQSTPTIAYICSGGWNQLFLIEFPNGDKVVARIPKTGGRSAHKIHSTVATMTMARYHLGLPVPEIFAWHPSNDNPVGAPYILLEFVDGTEPWQVWWTIPFKAQSRMLDELASYHAKFARPLPFKGIGSIFFATDLPESADLADASTYRLGEMSLSPNRESLEPPSHTLSLRLFWQRLWQHEFDFITKTYGVDRETVIADEDHPGFGGEVQTLGAFLDVSEYLQTLIANCPLPHQLELFEPCLAMTDYAFRNIKIDDESSRVTSFLDWDDVYAFPFLLCSRFPEDICFFDGSGEAWNETGPFTFLPLDEEPLESDNFDGPVHEPPQSTEPNDALLTEESDESSSEETTSEPPSDAEDQSDQLCADAAADDSCVPFPDDACEAESDRRRRARDTLLRREYARLLAQHDPRFGLDRFWSIREEPMKIQYLVMHGWTSWLKKDEWLKQRAKEIMTSGTHSGSHVSHPQG